MDKPASTEVGIGSEKDRENIGLVTAIKEAEPIAEFPNKLGLRYEVEGSIIDTKTRITKLQRDVMHEPVVTGKNVRLAANKHSPTPTRKRKHASSRECLQQR